MSSWSRYKELFSKASLERTYNDHVIYSSTTGIDKLAHEVFRKSLDDQLEIVSRKMLAGRYKFTKYRLKLLSKGRGKKPREISIPTIRDRIALKAMCEFLNDTFSSDVNFNLPQNIIRKVKEALASGEYTAFIKLDIKDFYPNIIHDLLLRQLKAKIERVEILNEIATAIATPTVEKANEVGANVQGVPQGLSISNVLAAIYLVDIDRRMSGRDFAYFRYVDDILILCKWEEGGRIVDEIVSAFKEIGLTIHPPDGTSEKSKLGKLSDDGFGYLGYRFEGGRITVREESLERLRDSLTSIFTAYKYSSGRDQDFLKWRLDLRIGGCIFERKRKGWLFFFSEIEDLNLLHELDHLMSRLCSRFGVAIQPKSFVRAFYQIRHHIYETRYIPNFDKYSISDMKECLEAQFKYKDLDKETERRIEYLFKKRISKQVRDLEEDLQDFGY